MDINLESKYLEELGKGDHKAFDMLYIQYSPRLKHFLTGFIKHFLTGFIPVLYETC